MASKSINLGNGLKFASISAGKAHFDGILKNTAIDAHVTNQQFNELKTLYEEY
jgi:hypothetical protein